MRKAAPVEYVRVCTAHGAGFFYIPGTDTCLRVGGRARFEAQYFSHESRNSSHSGYRGLGRLNIDARTATPYGTLRAFVRLEIASRTGGQLKSGTQERLGNAFSATGQDTVGQIQKYVDVDKAFVQFAGLTAGRAQSFFDFYAGDLELVGSGLYSNTNTNLLAYTATFGGGFSATLSMEDPAYRRNPVFAQFAAGVTGFAGQVPAAQSGVNFLSGAIPIAFVGTAFNAAGVATAGAPLDVAQRSNLPDFVGALRYDGAWGSAQLMGAVHEINTGKFTTIPVAGGAGIGNVVFAPGGVAAVNRVPDTTYGWAVGGGVKVNLPQLAPGDQVWLQGAYGQGAGAYTNTWGPGGVDTLSANLDGTFGVNQVDAAVTSRGTLELTETWSVYGAFLHYWNPEWRSAGFAGYGQTNYDARLRNANFGPAGITLPANAALPAVIPATLAATNATLRSFDTLYAGGNLIWSPVRDLDIGVEVIYQRYEIANGRVTASEGPTATATVADNIIARFRVQRDF
jgi:hypothetical protein